MKNKLIFLVATLTAALTSSCNAQTKPKDLGMQLFSAIQSFSSSSASKKTESANKLMAFFSNREDGLNFYTSLNSKAASRGVWDWSIIEYVDYFHKELKKNGKNYSAGCLVIKLNGKKDYKYLGIYFLNMQSDRVYKILKCKDNWSRDEWSKDKKERVISELDSIFEDWIN
jgi:hypothetical protein